MTKKKQKRNKDWEASDRAWRKEWEVRIKEMRVCAESARKSVVLITKTAELNDEQARLGVIILNKGIKDSAKYRKAVGLKPLPKAK